MNRLRATRIVAAALALAATVLLASAAPATGQVPGYPILDRFDRPNEDPLSGGGNWAQTDAGAWPTPMRLVNNSATRGASHSASYWTQASFAGGTGSVWAKWGGLSTFSAVGIALFKDVGGTNAVDGYEFRREIGAFFGIDRDFYFLYRVTNGVREQSLAGVEGGPFINYPYFNLRRVGSMVEGWASPDGVNWTLVLSATDTNHTTGTYFASIHANADTSGQFVDDFGAAASAAPPPPPGPPAGRSNGTFGGSGTISRTATRTRFDPVNTFTGFFVHQEQDLATPGTGVSFDWTRSYTSGDATVGPMGPGWTHTYAASLAVQANGDVLARGEEGQEVYFTKQANGAFVGAAGALAMLTSVAGGYELKRTDQVVYAFNAQGRLLSIKDRNNQGVTLAYDGSGRLQTITDADGRQTTVSYNASNLVSQVATAGGRSVSYGYTSGRLTSFTDVRAKNWSYTYDAAGRLATIVDPLNHTQVTNVYDANGRVTSQTDALNKTTTFAWDAAAEVATITDANTKVWRDDYSQGVLAKEIDPLNNETFVGHDADLNKTAVTSPTNQQTTMTYDAAGNLLTATAPPSLGSAQKSFVYNARNDPIQVTDARGKVTSYTYTPAGNVQTVTQDGIQVASYAYDASGRVLTFTDGRSKITTYTYFPATGYLESVTDPAGNKTTYTYDAAGRVTTRVDPKGNCAGCNPADFTWTYTYDPAGQQLTESDPLGHVTTNVYDDAGRLTSTTDANNHTTSYTYDSANRVLTETGPDPDGAGPQQAPVTTSTYDNVGNKLTETDPRGNTTTFAYNGANQLVSETAPDPDGVGPLAAPVTTHTYDANGNLASSVEPRGNATGANPDEYRTTYTYDAAGRQLTETRADPDGAGPALSPKTTNVYDPVGNLASVTDGNNHVTSYTYDAAGRILTVTAPDLGLTTYTYDAAGNGLTRKDALNHTTTYAYDDAGRLVSETSPDPDGPGPGGPAVTTYTYDPNGNPLTVTDPNGNATVTAGDGATTYAYDRANRLTSIDYSDVTPDVTFTYDNVGNRLTMVDGQGTETRTYDNLDRLLTVTRGPDTFGYLYDPASNLTRRTYPGGAVTDYIYDPLNRLSSVASGGQTTTYGYDVASNLTQTTLPASNGYSEARVYDRAGRLTDVATTRPAQVLGSEPMPPDALLEQTQMKGALITITDDPESSCGGGGIGSAEVRPPDPTNCWMVANSSASDPSVRVGFGTPGYRPRGLQTFKALVRTFGGSATPSARIDLYEAGVLRAQGQEQTIASTTGQVVTQTFDLASLALQDPTGAGVQARFVGTKAGSGSQRATVDLGALRWYASSVRSPQTLASFQSTLDPVGNPLQVARSGALTETHTYSYDANDRLTGVCFQAGTCPGAADPFLRFSYDKVGNRLSEQRPSGTSAYSYDARDRLLSAGATSYGYDQNGNQLTAGSRTFTYDLANRVKTTALGAQTTSYGYAGDGVRMQADAGGQTTRFLWDLNQALPQLALERDGQGTLLRSYLYGHSRLAQASSAGTFSFHPDPLGSVAAITSETGAHQTSFAYEPFGSLRSETRNALAPPASLFRFTGEQLDPTGLYHLRARQYDPGIGRFLQRDPADQTVRRIAITAYAYAADSPTTFVDPSGATLFPSSEAPAAAGLATSSAADYVEDGSPEVDGASRQLASVSDETAGILTLTARRRVAYSFQYFMSKGLRSFHSAGLVGNFLHETGGTLDPRTRQQFGGPGRGIAQWSVGDRWDTLLSFARRRRVSPWVLTTQVDFVWYELHTTETAAFSRLRRTNNVRDATFAVMDGYERPGVPHFQRRLEYARYVLANFG